MVTKNDSGRSYSADIVDDIDDGIVDDIDSDIF